MPYTKTPNEILDAMQTMSESESRLTALLCRQTYGYHTTSVRLTWDDIQQACEFSSRSTVARAVELVEARGFFKSGRRSMWHANSTESVLNEDSNSTDSVPNDAPNSTDSVLNDDSNSTDSVPDYGTESVPYYIEKKAPIGAKKKKARAGSPPPIGHPVWELPKTLKTAEFEAAWIDWFKHRLESGRYLTQTSGDTILAWMADLGPERAVAAIRHSIAKGWINIYEPEVASRASPNGRPAENTDLVPLGNGLF